MGFNFIYWNVLNLGNFTEKTGFQASFETQDQASINSISSWQQATGVEDQLSLLVNAYVVHFLNTWPISYFSVNYMVYTLAFLWITECDSTSAVCGEVQSTEKHMVGVHC